LAEFDIVIASTGSSLPVLGKGAVEAAIKQRRHKPMFMVDIAVPRDIEPEVGDLPDVYLYSIDDLTQIIETNLAERRQAADSAESFVLEGAHEYMRARRVQQSQALLKDFRARAKAVEQEELEKALQDLQRGASPEIVLARLSSSLTNKLIHAPTAAIREASADGRNDVLEYVRALYALPSLSSEPPQSTEPE
jgi:glutamyl-tRNA reductase